MSDPLFDLQGKIAVVTGGSRGLGREMVLAFAERGADCVIASRSIEACEAVAGEVRDRGRDAMPYALHAARWEEIDRFVDAVYERFGRIDVLVNNAGVGPAAASHDMPERLFDAIVGLNFKGPFRLASLVAHRMSQGDGGSIINVSSSGSLMPLPYTVAYGAAKAAMNAMTRSLAAEYGPKVRVNALSPGPFLTKMSETWSPEARDDPGNAAHRPGDPAEIVAAAVFLAGPGSSYVSGATVRVDGGMKIGQ